MKIINYPHPTLRHQSKPVTRVDENLKEIVAEMFELMYDARGIGLAANQVDLPLQLFVCNTLSDPDKGEELVFINPVLSSPKGNDTREEGCLSLPDVHANVIRPEKIHISAYDLQGNEIDQTVDGLLARVIQHEFDHLQGVLFIDRVSESVKKNLAGELDEFEVEYQIQLNSGKILDVDANKKRLAEIEDKYCS